MNKSVNKSRMILVTFMITISAIMAVLIILKSVQPLKIKIEEGSKSMAAESYIVDDSSVKVSDSGRWIKYFTSDFEMAELVIRSDDEPYIVKLKDVSIVKSEKKDTVFTIKQENFTESYELQLNKEDEKKMKNIYVDKLSRNFEFNELSTGKTELKEGYQ